MQLVKRLQEAYAKLNRDKIQERDVYKTYYDKTHKNVSFKVGDFVMLFTPRTEQGLTTKFLPRWTGPFKVTHKVNPVNYRLEDHAHPVHVQRLRPYRPWSPFANFASTLNPIATRTSSRYKPYPNRRLVNK